VLTTQFVPLAEIFRGLETGEPTPPRTIAITFDDSSCASLTIFASSARRPGSRGSDSLFFAI